MSNIFNYNEKSSGIFIKKYVQSSNFEDKKEFINSIFLKNVNVFNIFGSKISFFFEFVYCKVISEIDSKKISFFEKKKEAFFSTFGIK